MQHLGLSGFYRRLRKFDKFLFSFDRGDKWILEFVPLQKNIHFYKRWLSKFFWDEKNEKRWWWRIKWKREWELRWNKLDEYKWNIGKVYSLIKKIVGKAFKWGKEIRRWRFRVRRRRFRCWRWWRGRKFWRRGWRWNRK
jgi:hypothetical protein